MRISLEILTDRGRRGTGWRRFGAAVACCAAAGVGQAQTDGGTVSFSVGDDDRVRIEVPSATDRYHVLYYRASPDDALTEDAVAVHPGKEGSVILSEPLRAGSGGAYRVATHSTGAAGDVDGDGTDDLTELGHAEAGARAPLNGAESIPIGDGAVAIPDMATFQRLSFQGHREVWDEHLGELEHIKFIVSYFQRPRAAVHFMNSNRWSAHLNFWLYALRWDRFELYRPNHLLGEITYFPNVVGPGGEVGTFRYQYQPHNSWSFNWVARGHELIAASMPFLRNNLVYHPAAGPGLERYEAQKAKYDASRVPVYLDEDLFEASVFSPLNAAVGYGLLRVFDGSERPTFKDVALLRRIPNELPAVGGVISLDRQTPLSHVNLRAIQDGVPNAYIGNALDDPAIAALVGKYVRFEVAANPQTRFEWTDPNTGEAVSRAGFSITESTVDEVAAHHAARRPDAAQTPPRNLAATTYSDLDGIVFNDSDTFGVKAANLAVLRTLALPDVAVPDGYALPFYYYHEFMKHNGFYDTIDEMLGDADFQASIGTRDAELKKLRRRIENGAMPEWMRTSLAALQALFPADTSIRCRSSTNNEDLPGFSGAGLYDSYTHHPTEGHLEKSVKQVFASMWNLRAFEERAFYRVDHKAAAMGVLLHPNFSDEQSNGVAVSDDPIYGTADAYYVNTQVGEELVTNPSAAAVPEELLLREGENFETTVVRRSNLVADEVRVLSEAHTATLHAALETIHVRFATLYGVSEDDEFAMDIEFKVTAANEVAIKQARPWVY